jgi:hypothetical protein
MALTAASSPASVNPNQTVDLSKFEPGNGPPPGMTWSETQGQWMPSDSVVGAMPTSNLVLPQTTQQPLTNTPLGGQVPNYVTPPTLATPGSAASGTLTQGSALPNITTTQQQATAAPSWYTDYLSNLAQQGQTAAQGAQYVGASPLQQMAFEQTAGNVGSYQPSLEAATNLARQTGEYDVARAAGEFMNPYTERVVNELGRLGRSNIEKYLAPSATSAAVGSGQFGSKRGAEVLGQAINTGLSNLNLAQSQALQTGYGQALQAAQQQEAARLAASQQLGNLASQRQALGLGDINALATIGSQQQQIAQNEQLFPFQTAAQQAALLRGYTIPTSVSSTYTGPIPGAYSPSPLSQIAGVGSLLGALATPGASGTSPGANIIGALGSAGKALYDLIPSFGGSNSSIEGTGNIAYDLINPDTGLPFDVYGDYTLF